MYSYFKTLNLEFAFWSLIDPGTEDDIVFNCRAAQPNDLKHSLLCLLELVLGQLPDWFDRLNKRTHTKTKLVVKQNIACNTDDMCEKIQSLEFKSCILKNTPLKEKKKGENSGNFSQKGGGG